MSPLTDNELRAAWDRLRDPMRPLSFEDASARPTLLIAIRAVAGAMRSRPFDASPALPKLSYQRKTVTRRAPAAIDLKRRASGEKDDE